MARIEFESDGREEAACARMMTRAEAADVLSVSLGTVDNYIKAGRLRASRLGGPGGAVRIAPADLAAFVEAGKRGVE